MHVNRALLQPFPDFLRRIKTAREIGHGVSRNRQLEWPAGRKKPASPKTPHKIAAASCGFPFVNLLDVFEKFDVALDDLGKRHVAPAPEFRRGRAGDAGDGRRRAVVPDRDFFAFVLGQRRVARKQSPSPFNSEQGGRRSAACAAWNWAVMRSVSRATSARPSVATEIFCWARSMVTASSAGSSASVSTTERARQGWPRGAFGAIGGRRIHSIHL